MTCIRKGTTRNVSNAGRDGSAVQEKGGECRRMRKRKRERGGERERRMQHSAFGLRGDRYTREVVKRMGRYPEG